MHADTRGCPAIEKVCQCTLYGDAVGKFDAIQFRNDNSSFGCALFTQKSEADLYQNLEYAMDEYVHTSCIDCSALV